MPKNQEKREIRLLNQSTMPETYTMSQSNESKNLGSDILFAPISVDSYFHISERALSLVSMG